MHGENFLCIRFLIWECLEGNCGFLAQLDYDHKLRYENIESEGDKEGRRVGE